MLRSIADGLRYVLQDRALRLLFVVSAVLNLAVAGPLAVGLAAMANFRFGSAAAYGIMLSCFEGGALAGMLLSGALQRFAHRGWSLTALTFATGLSLIGLAVVNRLVAVAVVLAVMGLCAGFVNIQIMSWIQARVATGNAWPFDERPYVLRGGIDASLVRAGRSGGRSASGGAVPGGRRDCPDRGIRIAAYLARKSFRMISPARCGCGLKACSTLWKRYSPAFIDNATGVAYHDPQDIPGH